MRTQALTITFLFCLTGWGSCGREGVEHPSKSDAGAPADGETDGSAKVTEEPSKEVAPAPESAKTDDKKAAKK